MKITKIFVSTRFFGTASPNSFLGAEEYAKIAKMTFHIARDDGQSSFPSECLMTLESRWLRAETARPASPASPAISPACFRIWPKWRRSRIAMTEKRRGRSSERGIYPTTKTSSSTMHGTSWLHVRVTFDRARVRLNLKEAAE